MLRRGLRKLIVDLEASVDAETKAAASATKKKKGKKGVAQKERDDAVRNKMEVRARHVHEQLVPRAFLYVFVSRLLRRLIVLLTHCHC